MSTVEPRWPCPVCLGVTMTKAPLGVEGGAPFLDHCSRCGGIWFEHGEVELVRQRAPEEIWLHVAQRPELVTVRCHSCHGLASRDADACRACGHRHVIDCPGCARPMEPVAHAGFTLDVCRRCRGVWFDHHELAMIWEQSRDAVASRLKRRGTSRHAADAGADAGSALLLDALWIAPDAVAFGVVTAADAAGHALAAAGPAPEMMQAAAEATAEAASGVFESLLEIVGGIFS